MNALRSALLAIMWAFSFGWGRRWYRELQLMAWRRKLTRVSEATSGAHVAEGIDRKKRFSLLELMLNYSNQGLAMVDAHGQVLIFNKRALEYTGVDPDTFKLPATANDVRQWQLANGEFGVDGVLLPPEVRSYFMTGKGQLPKSYVRRRPDGTVLEVRSEPLPGGGIVQSYTDITEVTRAKEGAEAGARAKSAFLATMSHEVRTPLNGVLGVAALLRQTKLTDEQAEYVRIIAESGDALLTVINDVLDFSKLEAGMMQFDPTPAVLKDVASGALDLVRASAASKGITLSCEIGSEVPSSVLIDAKRVRQILLNLLSNAVKFTAKGGVTLKVARLPEPFAHHIRFEVRDTGIGISADGRQKLFKEFSQVDGSIDRQYGGTGLGLAICKKIVEAMKGTIGVDSKEGAGSSFWFEIPAPASDGVVSPEAKAAPVRVSLRTYRILVAEDVATNQLVARKMLESLGHVADIANDGLEALERARQADYDLIFMDMQMPGMNGLLATRKLRSFGGKFETIPVVAMTANTSSADEQECRDAGMDDFISKPLDITVLSAAIERVMARHDAAAAPAPRPGDAQVAWGTAVASSRVLKNLVAHIGPEAMDAVLRDFEAGAERQLAELAQPTTGNDPVRLARLRVGLHESLLALGLAEANDAPPRETADWNPDIELPRLRRQVAAAAALCRAEMSAATLATASPGRNSDPEPSALDRLVAHIGPEAVRDILRNFVDGCEQRFDLLAHATTPPQREHAARLVADLDEGLQAFGLQPSSGFTFDDRHDWEPVFAIPLLRRALDAAVLQCEAAIASLGAPTAGCAMAHENPTIACNSRGLSHGAEFICERHLQMVMTASIERKLQTGARLQWLRARWDDQDYFDRIVASGRYLKLCEALRCAEELDEQAWTGVKRAFVYRPDNAPIPFRPAATAERVKLSA